MTADTSDLWRPAAEGAPEPVAAVATGTMTAAPSAAPTQSASQHTVGVRIPEGGIELPLDHPGDLTAWAEAVAYSRLGAAGTPEEVTNLAAALLGATADSQERGATVAISLCPYPQTGELGRVEIRDFAPSPANPELPTLAELVDFVAAPGRGAMDQPAVVYGRLPLGPAARVLAEQLGAEDEHGDAHIVRNLIYIVRPEDREIAVVLSLTWQAASFSDLMHDLADRLAQSLVVS